MDGAWKRRFRVAWINVMSLAILFFSQSASLSLVYQAHQLDKIYSMNGNSNSNGSGTKYSELQLTAPYATEIGSHSIILSWGPLNQSDATYIPQWTGPSLSEDWTYGENVSGPPVTVRNLYPYSWYKFRVWAVVSQQYVLSPESPMYQTEPFGVPSSPPVIQSVGSMSSESVEVTWSPPERPGGPVVGYNLNLTSQSHSMSMTVGQSDVSATFFPTIPNTTYSLSIAAVNKVGQGPAALTTITTAGRHDHGGARWLFLSTMNSLRRKKVDEAEFLSEADCLPGGLIDSNITGVALFQSANQVYFSEGKNVWIKGAGNLSDQSDLRLFRSSAEEVSALSVDWLYRKLYFVSAGKVYNCMWDNCSDPVDIGVSLTSSPLRILADPYNGWLFLCLPDGVYRTILPERSEQPRNVSLVLRSNSVRDFEVSFPNKKLVLFLEESGTLAAVSLDGSSVDSLRSDVTVKPVRGLAYEDGDVVLTNGKAVFHQVRQGDIVSFNEYPVECDLSTHTQWGFDNLHFSSRSSQTYPVPRIPRELSVLFGSESARLRWKEPDLRTAMSPSAWQNWTYTVVVFAHSTVAQTKSKIPATEAMVTGLQSSSFYTLTVWAESPGGRSAAVVLKGSTLPTVSDTPYIVGASNNNLWKQELDSFDFQLLFHNVTAVRDMDWYDSTLYWTNHTGHVNLMKLENLDPISVPVATNAESVAFDWLGGQLYWTCNYTQVCRGFPSSTELEVVIQSEKVITSLVIDSLRAVIYWSTKHSVESSRLNGENHVALQELSIFSGKKVAGMAIDLNKHFLYWLVQDGSALHLYRANVLNKSWQINKTTRWSSSEVSYHQTAYYGGRLVWLDGGQKLRVQELSQTKSVLVSHDRTLRAFALLQGAIKPLPEGFDSPPAVIPEAVAMTSIHLEGDVAIFQVTWKPVTNVDFGSVFYCVVSKVLDFRKGEPKKKGHSASPCPPLHTLNEPFLEVRGFPPNTKFTFSITPYTYWGKGATTVKVLQSPDTSTSTIIGIVAGVLSVAFFTVMLAIFVWYRQKKKEAESHGGSQTCLPGPDEELEEIRGLVGLANACYAISTFPVRSEKLPVFPRHCLKLHKLLGSGAFGEVYEGIAVGVTSVEVMTEKRVAVKTLKKGATDNEKMDFLKEAHLMSQFDHPNILRLLGVCLENEPQYLILELMEGGDLRSYLRGARPSATHGALLDLADLLNISLDVARGCACLEKMHFVHRDLAARNCLVSVRGYADPDRAVKIGDFGLARDIYKNDYYRKRGEGLLPVRWMSPESLTDGVFNKQSDVWAFGVFLWEVFTLGKQPYPAYSNLEILHVLNSGRRLLPPADCPQSVYKLMLDCWARVPYERPSFRCLQEKLTELRESVSRLQGEDDGAKGQVNYGFQADDDVTCCAVDEDEGPGLGLTHMLSAEGLNYLMFNGEVHSKESLDGQQSPE